MEKHKGVQPQNEPIHDSAMDIMGYGLILTLLLSGTWDTNFSKDHTLGILTDLNDLFWSKLHDYGKEDVKAYGVDGVINRLHDKIARIKNLTGHNKLKVKGCNRFYDGIFPPKKPGDCGYDLVVAETTEIPHNSNTPVNVPSRISIKIPSGYFALVTGRSSTASKLGLHVVTGIIDNGYTGELYACCYNFTDNPVVVKKGDRIAQVILLPMHTPEIEYVDELPITERGATGFGSSGK